MLTSTTKRFFLPFLVRKDSLSEVEAAAVFAVAEFERNKGGGLIARQPKEKLVSISKVCYPLWLYPTNDAIFIFDGFAYSNYCVSYAEVPSAKVFMESLETNLRPRENYMGFLQNHKNYFEQPKKETQFVFRGLIDNLNFKSEFSLYRKEATEVTAQTNLVFLLPTLQETAVSSTIAEFDKLQSFLREEVERLHECTRLIHRTTNQYITELDYEMAAIKEEADAKIRAQEELVYPKIAKLTKEYKQKIKAVTESFDKELESLKKHRTKTLKSIEVNEEKIKIYQRDAKSQAKKKHAFYEKHWKAKIKQTQKEVNALKKELKNVENNFKKLSKQKGQELSKLNFGLDGEIKFARQPLLELEAGRDAKILVFKKETDRLFNEEKYVNENLFKNLKLRESIRANFEVLGFKDPEVKAPSLFYVPFYVACYEMSVVRRYLILPPSTISSIDFSAKLKGALGMSKIKDLLTPRFKAVAALISHVELFAKQNSVFESQLNGLAQKNNLLNNSLFMENVVKGLVYLKHQGWVSDKEQQVLSNRLRT